MSTLPSAMTQCVLVCIHYLVLRRNLVKKSFVGWRDLPQKMKREEEKQKRKLELRKRVAELIPDFKPTEQITSSVSSVVESEDIS